VTLIDSASMPSGVPPTVESFTTTVTSSVVLPPSKSSTVPALRNSSLWSVENVNRSLSAPDSVRSLVPTPSSLMVMSATLMQELHRLAAASGSRKVA
jgi:hypothetical protein